MIVMEFMNAYIAYMFVCWAIYHNFQYKHVSAWKNFYETTGSIFFGGSDEWKQGTASGLEDGAGPFLGIWHESTKQE